MNFSDKQKGLGLSLAGVLMITPDSLFVRLISLDTWELVFYRGLVPFIFMLVLLIFYFKAKIFHALLVTGFAGLFYAALVGTANATFIISLSHTNVANTLIMISLIPFATAILSSIFLNEKPDKRMWLTIAACFSVVLFIFYDSYEGGRVYGDLFGLLTALLVGGSAVILRYYKKFNFLPTLLYAKMTTMIIALFFIEFPTSSLIISERDTYLVIAMGFFCIFIPFIFITLAPRYIPAYEVQIFFVLETILGPIWVWIFVKESPTLKTLIGGIFIIMIIFIHTILELKKMKKEENSKKLL